MENNNQQTSRRAPNRETYSRTRRPSPGWVPQTRNVYNVQNHVNNIHLRRIKDKNYVRIRIRNKRGQLKNCDVLVDSGNNSVTLISPEFLEYLDPQARVTDLPEDLKRFTTAGIGQNLKPLGVAEKPIQIEFFSPDENEKRIKRCSIRPVIVDNLAYNLLFSFRDLAIFGAKINPLRHQESLEFHEFEPTLTIPMFEKRKNQFQAAVHTTQKITIKPGSEVVFPASSGFSENERCVNFINRAVFFEPDDEKLNNSGLLALGSIDKIGERDQIRVRVWNPTEHPVTIPHRTTVGTAYRFSDTPNDYVCAAIASNVNDYVESWKNKNASRPVPDEFFPTDNDSGYESGAQKASHKKSKKKNCKNQKLGKQQTHFQNKQQELNQNSTQQNSWLGDFNEKKHRRFIKKAAEMVEKHATRFNKKLPENYEQMAQKSVNKIEPQYHRKTEFGNNQFQSKNKQNYPGHWKNQKAEHKKGNEFDKNARVQKQSQKAVFKNDKLHLKGFEKQLWDAFNYDDNNHALTITQRIQVCKRIALHRKAFALAEDEVGLVEGVELDIDTGVNPPIRDRCRPMNPIVQKQLDKQLKRWLDQKVIERGTGEWASAIVPVRKKDALTFRFCVDYRRLNAITKVCARPIANMMDKLARLKGPAGKPLKIFAKFDLRDAYHCCRVKKEDIPKTGFVTPQGLFQFRRMPFGLSGAPGNFHRVVQLLEKGMFTRDNAILSHTALYFDDAIIGADNVDELLDKIDVFLETVTATGLRLALGKSSVGEKSISWLGHIISGKGIMPDYNLVRTIKEWEAPETNEELLSLFGMLNYFRSFIRMFSGKASKISDLIKRAPTWRKGTKPAKLEGEYKWTPECQEQLDALLDLLTKPPILNHPIFDDPQKGGQFVVVVDTSKDAVGCGIAQRQLVTNPVNNKTEWRDVMIAYGSRKLTEAQSKWGSYKLELHGLVVACQAFRYFLLTGGPSIDGVVNTEGGGHPNIIRTDHRGLQWLQRTSNSKVSREIFRMKQQLNDYQLDIRYTPATQMGLADAISRKKFKENDWGTMEEIQPLREERWDIEYVEKVKKDVQRRIDDELWLEAVERNKNVKTIEENSQIRKTLKVGFVEKSNVECCVVTRAGAKKKKQIPKQRKKQKKKQLNETENRTENVSETDAETFDAEVEEPPDAEFLEPEDTWAELTHGPPPDALENFEVHYPQEGPSWWMSQMLRSVQKIDPVCADIMKCLKGEANWPKTKAQIEGRVSQLYGPMVINKESKTKEDREVAAYQLNAKKMYQEGRNNNFELKKLNEKDTSPTLIITKEIDGRKRQLLVIPKDLWTLMLQSCHHAQGTFHLGIDRSTHQCLLHLWWPNIRTAAEEYISGCLVCQNGKRLKSGRGAGLGKTTSRPHDRLTNFSCDLVKYPKGRGGYTYLFTMCDMATGWMEAWPLRKSSGQAISQILETEIFNRYGENLTLTCDQGREFISRHLKQIVAKHNSRLYFGTTYNPNSLPVERQHRILNSLIRCHLVDANLPKEHWPQFLANALYTMRCSPDTDSKLSPFYRVYGKHPCTEMSTWLGRNPNDNEEIMDGELIQLRDQNFDNNPYPSKSEPFVQPSIEEEDEESMLVKTGDQIRELQKVTIGNGTYLAQVNSVTIDNYTHELAQARRDLAAQKKHKRNKKRFDSKVQPKKYAPVVDEMVDWFSPIDKSCPNNRKMANRWRGPFVVIRTYDHPQTVQCAELDLETGVLNRNARRDIPVGQLRPSLQLSFRKRPRKGWQPPWLPKP